MEDGAKRVHAWLKGDNVYVVSSAITDQGMEISHGEPAVVSIRAASVERRSLLALITNFGIIPHPTSDEWRRIPKILVKAAKMRSWISFTTGVREISIDLLAGGRLRLNSSKPSEYRHL